MFVVGGVSTVAPLLCAAVEEGPGQRQSPLSAGSQCFSLALFLLLLSLLFFFTTV